MLTYGNSGHFCKSLCMSSCCVLSCPAWPLWDRRDSCVFPGGTVDPITRSSWLLHVGICCHTSFYILYSTCIQLYMLIFNFTTFSLSVKYMYIFSQFQSVFVLYDEGGRHKYLLFENINVFWNLFKVYLYHLS